jgi:hypothetical protein
MAVSNRFRHIRRLGQDVVTTDSVWRLAGRNTTNETIPQNVAGESVPL